MPFLKKAEVQNIKEKYGSQEHKGIVALEKIAQGEVIFTCDKDKCMYYPLHGSQNEYTKEELNKLLQQYPDSREYISRYSCTAADDVYRVPNQFRTGIVTEECALFNHSCSPNVGYSDDWPTVHVTLRDMEPDEELTVHVALRDIEPGEELTVHYGTYDTDHSLNDGLQCKCGSSNCSKTLHFDFYKNPEFQDRYYKHCSDCVKAKIRKLRPDIES